MMTRLRLRIGETISIHDPKPEPAAMPAPAKGDLDGIARERSARGYAETALSGLEQRRLDNAATTMVERAFRARRGNNNSPAHGPPGRMPVVEIAVAMHKGGPTSLRLGLAIGLFTVARFFVYRAFYGMRIPEEKRASVTHDAIAGIPPRSGGLPRIREDDFAFAPMRAAATLAAKFNLAMKNDTQATRASAMNTTISRRKFIAGSLAGSMGVGLARGAGTLAAAAPTPPAPGATPAASPVTLPKGKIAGLQVSRLILGTNIITGHMHDRGLHYLKDLSLRYNTDERILQTFALAEANGIDTFMTHHEPRVIRLLKQHRDAAGGKMKLIVAPEPKVKDPAEYKDVVQQLVNAAADGIYVHGATTDPLMERGKLDLILKFVEIIKATGLPTGVGCHALDSLKALEAAKAPCDFYVKTVHHHNYPGAPRPGEATTPWRELPPAYWCRNPEETVAFMQTVEKPWIGFKVMAAGAIPPRDAFRYAFTSGADFILAGMFDFQVAEDAAIVNDLLAGNPKRNRPWRA